jgi:hypothetical protein
MLTDQKNSSLKNINPPAHQKNSTRTGLYFQSCNCQLDWVKRHTARNYLYKHLKGPKLQVQVSILGSLL